MLRDTTVLSAGIRDHFRPERARRMQAATASSQVHKPTRWWSEGDLNPRFPVARNGDPSGSPPFAGSLRTDGLSQEKTARLTASAVPVGYKADPFARGQKDRCGEANGFTATSEQEIRAESARPAFEFRYAGFGAVS
jgi:hypothetical protein